MKIGLDVRALRVAVVDGKKYRCVPVDAERMVCGGCVADELTNRPGRDPESEDNICRQLRETDARCPACGASIELELDRNLLSPYRPIERLGIGHRVADLGEVFARLLETKRRYERAKRGLTVG